MQRFSLADHDFEARVGGLATPMDTLDPTLVDSVRDIIAEVRSGGDRALLQFTKRFDQHDAMAVSELIVEGDALKAFESQVTDMELAAITEAASRIRRYHEEQISSDWSICDEYGSRLGQRIGPMRRVGLYVPGGKASYPSSVLMNAIPAKVAGVAEVVMVAPTPGGQINPLVLAAASLAGVDQVLTVVERRRLPHWLMELNRFQRSIR